MPNRSVLKALLLGLSVAVSAWFQPTARADWVVKAGYDLFQTVAVDTSFPELGNLMGVPLGSFDFGPPVGTVPTGPTDTIVQRLSDHTVPSVAGSSGTSDIVLRALQLETVPPLDFLGNGLDNYFVTLTPGWRAPG